MKKGPQLIEEHGRAASPAPRRFKGRWLPYTSHSPHFHLVAELHTGIILLRDEEAHQLASQSCQPSSLQGSRAGGCPSLGAGPPHPPARPRHTSATSSPLPLATRANIPLLPPSAPEHSTKDPSAAQTCICMRIMRLQFMDHSSSISMAATYWVPVHASRWPVWGTFLQICCFVAYLSPSLLIDLTVLSS